MHCLVFSPFSAAGLLAIDRGMTPAARFQAAIEILDAAAKGPAIEQVLTGWSRRSRFAGSRDRAAIRDIVFDILRRRRSCEAIGGGMGGRALVLGHCRQAGPDPQSVFTGVGHAPLPLSEVERQTGAAPEPGTAAALDCPDWLLPRLRRALGAQTDPVLELLRHRAPVFLRVNLARTSREQAQAALLEEEIATRPNALSPSALEVTGGARRVRLSRCFTDGLVELQDAASQAVADLVPLCSGETLLDYCAGGGGKTLAVAARVDGRFLLHDVRQDRMRDAPARAARAGIAVSTVMERVLGARAPFPVVLVDAPCSGSGAWRRSPEGKWRLTEARVTEFCALQDKVLDRAAALVAPQGGRLVYATCSLLDEENADRIEAFIERHPGWRWNHRVQLTPLDGGDGFFCANLERL